MSIEYMRTKHTISNTDITLAKLQPTKADNLNTRKLIITTVADSVELEFSTDEFDLFKAILREY